jgi:hypothetical protein
MTMTHTPESLTALRRRTTLALSGLELPDCFADATLAAAINAHERTSKSAKVSRRRLLGKVERIQAVQS